MIKIKSKKKTVKIKDKKKTVKIKGQNKRKKLKKINKLKKKPKTSGIPLVLFSIFLLGIFAETVRTLPAGASNEYYRGFFDNSKSSPDVYDDKLAKTFLIKKTPKIDSKTKETLVLISSTIVKALFGESAWTKTESRYSFISTLSG